MKIKSLVIGVLIAMAMASCDKESNAPGSENRNPDSATSPAPTVTVKSAGTANGAAEEVPMSKANADSSPTPPK